MLKTTLVAKRIKVRMPFEEVMQNLLCVSGLTDPAALVLRLDNEMVQSLEPQTASETVSLRLGPPWVEGEHDIDLTVWRGVGCQESLRFQDPAVLVRLHRWLAEATEGAVRLVLRAPTSVSRDEIESADGPALGGFWSVLVAEEKAVRIAASKDGEPIFAYPCYNQVDRAAATIMARVRVRRSSNLGLLEQEVFGCSLGYRVMAKFELRAVLDSFSIWGDRCALEVGRLVPSQPDCMSSVLLASWGGEHGEGLDNQLMSVPVKLVAQGDVMEGVGKLMVGELPEDSKVENCGVKRVACDEGAVMKDPVLVELRLGEVALSLMDLARLRVGDFLEIEVPESAPCELVLGSSVVARAVFDPMPGGVNVRIVEVVASY